MIMLIGRETTKLIQRILVASHRAHEGAQLHDLVVRHLHFSEPAPRSRPPGVMPPCVLPMSIYMIHPYGFLTTTRRTRTFSPPPPTGMTTQKTYLTLTDQEARPLLGDVLWVSWAPKIHFGLNYTTCSLIRAFVSLPMMQKLKIFSGTPNLLFSL